MKVEANYKKLQEENDNLSSQNILTLIEYIKSSFDIAVQMKAEKKFLELKNNLNIYDENYFNDYETLLRKEESDIRQHISIEQQLKLHGESLIDKIDELEKDNLILTSKLEKYKNKINENEDKEFKIELLSNEIKNLKEMNKKLLEDIKKYKTLISQKDKEIKNLESKIKSNINNNNLNNNNSIENLEKKNSSSKLDKNQNTSNTKSNSGNASLTSLTKLKISEEITKHNSIKVSHLPIEKLKLKEKLEEYRRLHEDKMNDITRNKSNHCKTYRDRLSSNISSHSKEHSLEKGNRSHLSSMSGVNLNNNELNKKLIDITIKAVKKEKEERKNKTPMRKIPINNKTKSLAEYLKKSKSKIIVNKIINNNHSKGNIPVVINQSANPSFCSEIYGNSIENTNVKNNNSIVHSKNYSISQLNLRQLIFSKCSQSEKSNKKL